ncbi:MAG: PDZ domain-containing protein, partial [Chlamydiae bacterium]|nr:PDZ domain-containing protein [Chlamydiota bacterium]
MYRKILFFFLVALHSFCLAKPPSLTPRDTKNKIEEILKAHVSYQRLNEEIVQRALQNYLSEVDPLKTYFLENEIVEFNNPSQEFLQSILADIHDENFSVFLTLHNTFLSTLDRRERLERDLLDFSLLPEGVKATEFKNLSWAADESGLKDRILRIKALQLEAAEKLSSADQNQFLQKLAKRRVNKENEFRGKTEDERKQIALAYTLKSISSALDSQTAYFTPAEATTFMMQIQQKLYGIGAQLRDDLNGLTIIRLIEGGPAVMSNLLRLGDRIIAVNKEPILGMDITEAVDLIRGKQGTPVELTVIRPNEAHPDKEETLDITIVRDEVVLKESRLSSTTHPFGDGVIGIFHLFSFYEDKKNSSSLDLAKAIDEVKKTNNLKGVILDLRNNAGGLLS